MSDPGAVLDAGSPLKRITDPALDYERKKRRTLAMLLVYAGVLGVLTTLLPKENQFLEFVFGLPLLLLTIQWCFVDARQHNYVIGRFLRVGLVLLLLVAFPIYIFQTRGLSGFKTLALVALFIAAMAACHFATAFMAFHFPR